MPQQWNLELMYDRVSPGGFIVADDYLDCILAADRLSTTFGRRAISEPIVLTPINLSQSRTNLITRLFAVCIGGRRHEQARLCWRASWFAARCRLLQPAAVAIGLKSG